MTTDDNTIKNPVPAGAAMTPQEFRQARRRLGLTQTELGQIMGMRQEAVARIETTRAPTQIQAAFMRHLLACSGRSSGDAQEDDEEWVDDGW